MARPQMTPISKNIGLSSNVWSAQTNQKQLSIKRVLRLSSGLISEAKCSPYTTRQSEKPSNVCACIRV